MSTVPLFKICPKPSTFLAPCVFPSCFFSAFFFAAPQQMHRLQNGHRRSSRSLEAILRPSAFRSEGNLSDETCAAIYKELTEAHGPWHVTTGMTLPAKVRSGYMGGSSFLRLPLFEALSDESSLRPPVWSMAKFSHVGHIIGVVAKFSHVGHIIGVVSGVCGTHHLFSGFPQWSSPFLAWVGYVGSFIVLVALPNGHPQFWHG